MSQAVAVIDEPWRDAIPWSPSLGGLAPGGLSAGEPDPRVTMVRWAFDAPVGVKTLVSSPDEHVFSLCLRATRLELREGGGLAFDGVMRAGAVHISGPSRQLIANIGAACDFLHLHVPNRLLSRRLAAIGASGEALEGLAGRTLSDALVEQLAKLLLTDCALSDAVYAIAIVQTLLTRVLHIAQSRASAAALPKWRLRRVQALIDERLGDTLTLNDMATAAGLSRMHFAAQFRAATGSSPHEYLLCRRIEAAKALLGESGGSLAEIALQVGFLAQSHFTTVFKRLTGATPAQWRRAHREIIQLSPELASARRNIEPWTGFPEGVQP